MNRLYKLTTFSILALTSSAMAHFDFDPSILNNRIVTSGEDDSTGDVIDPLIVAGFDFGEVPSDPYNINDPGFSTNGPSVFTQGSELRLTPLSAGGHYLSYWDGTGAVSFSAPVNGTSLVLSGSPTRYVNFTSSSATLAPASDTSLLIGSFGTGSSLHVHLDSSLLLNGDQTPGAIAEGAYLLSFSLSNPTTGVLSSDPLYIVYNNGLEESAHDSAIDYVYATYVPEPTTLMLICVALPLAARRRL